MKLTPYLRNIILATPLLFLTLILFWIVSATLDLSLHWRVASLGALGWWIALLLRLPVIIIAKQIQSRHAQLITILASGPTEEITRLIFLLLIGLNIENAISLALGWAGIEIIYSLIQSAALANLEQKTDEKAEEAKAFLKIQGMDKSMQPSAPFWGIVERISANTLHLSFSLLLVANPLFIAITAPVHSGLNLLVTKLLKRSLVEAELLLLLISALVLTVSLMLVV